MGMLHALAVLTLVIGAPQPVDGFEETQARIEAAKTKPQAEAPPEAKKDIREQLRSGQAICKHWPLTAEDRACADQVLAQDIYVAIRSGRQASTLCARVFDELGWPKAFDRRMVPLNENAGDGPRCSADWGSPQSPEDSTQIGCMVTLATQDLINWADKKPSKAAKIAAELLRGALPADVVEADSWTIAGLPKGPVSVGRLRIEIGDTVVARIEGDEKSVGVGIAYMVEQTNPKPRPIPDGVVYLLDHRRVRHAQDRLTGLFQRFSAGEHILEPIQAGERLERTVAVKLPVEVVGRTFALVLSDHESGAVVTIPVSLSPFSED
jgi:hypothetical protein